MNKTPTGDKIYKIIINSGGLRRIADAPRPCLSPEHNPPSRIYLEAGSYEYVCPSCGHKTTFSVPLIT